MVDHRPRRARKLVPLPLPLPSFDARQMDRQSVTTELIFLSSLASCTAPVPTFCSDPGRRQRPLPPADDRDLQRLHESLQPAGPHARRRTRRHQRSRIRTRYAHDSLAMRTPPSLASGTRPCAHHFDRPPIFSLARPRMRARARVWPLLLPPFRRARPRRDRQLSRALARDARWLAAARTCPRSGLAFTTTNLTRLRARLFA